jgi:hypothetical protein
MGSVLIGSPAAAASARRSGIDADPRTISPALEDADDRAGGGIAGELLATTDDRPPLALERGAERAGAALPSTPRPRSRPGRAVRAGRQSVVRRMPPMRLHVAAPAAWRSDGILFVHPQQMVDSLRRRYGRHPVRTRCASSRAASCSPPPIPRRTSSCSAATRPAAPVPASGLRRPHQPVGRRGSRSASASAPPSGSGIRAAARTIC